MSLKVPAQCKQLEEQFYRSKVHHLAVTSENVRRNIRKAKLNNFVLQNGFYCHVCRSSLCAISYQATMAKEKQFLHHYHVKNL